jgi:hypothetical protein
MSTESNLTLREGKAVEPKRLWFGTITAAVAWALVGMIDIVITWRSCMVQADYGIPPTHPVSRILYGGVAAVFLAVSISAGYQSYRTLQYLSNNRKLGQTKAVQRKEFMAFAGLVVTVTMGMGLFWLVLPPFFLDFCWRAR